MAKRNAIQRALQTLEALWDLAWMRGDRVAADQIAVTCGKLRAVMAGI